MGPYTRRSSWPFAFLACSPSRLPSMGRNPHRRSSDRRVKHSFECPNPYAGLLSLAGVLSSGHRRLAYPHDPLCADRLLSTKRQNPQTGGCPWLLTSNLYHLPVAFTANRTLLLAWVCATHFTRLTFWIPRMQPLEDHTLLIRFQPRYPSHGRRALHSALPSHLS